MARNILLVMAKALAKGMTLKVVAGFPQAGIPKDKLAEIDAKLQALG